MNNLVTFNLKDNQVTTYTTIIAEAFGKKHCDVLRAVQQLDLPEDFEKRNFALSSYHAGTRDYPMYEMTRDGFTLLAMGFTGKKAMEWKVKFIEAFNAMEQALKSQVSAAVPAAVDMKAIGGVVKKCAAVAVREELATLLNGDKTEDWEVTDKDLLFQLYRWHCTKNKNDTLEFRRLHAENDLLKQKLEAIKQAVE